VFRKALVIALVVAGVGCTPAQIATLQQLKGPIAEADQATIEALPDHPILDGTTVINLDGTLTVAADDQLAPRDRFLLAVSRTSWATRPDLHGWLSCVVRRESNFIPPAHNQRGADNSYGYMQINMRGSLGPARMAAHGLSSYEDLFDPETNLEAGYQLFAAAGTTPWSATRRGC